MNKWNSKRIAFVSILIAMSISFVIIGAQVAALSSLPTFKLSLAGLPIKIIGYLFGPIIGFITGFITDLLSFLFIPTFYFPVYSIALGISGSIPGLCAIFFNYLYPKFEKRNVIKKLKEKRIMLLHELKLINTENIEDLKSIAINKYVKKINNKLNKINKKIDEINLWKNEKYQVDFAFWIGVIVILLLLIPLTLVIFLSLSQTQIDEYFSDKGILNLFSNKYIFCAVILIGVGSGLILLIIFKFKMKSETFLTFVPILIFVLLTEYVNLMVIAYADEKTLKIPFITSFIASLLSSPIKIWMNLIIISFAIKITLPLIKKKTFNGYI